MITFSLPLLSDLFSENTAPNLGRVGSLNLKKTTLVGDFSFFEKPVTNTIPSGIMSILDVYKAISGADYASSTRVLRGISEIDRARAFKSRNFDFICASGIFSKRCETGLVRHSNLIVIDFDHLKRLHQLKTALINNPYFDTVMIFISPSGDGLKWIVKIDLEKNTHLQWFRAIETYVKINYHIQIDKSGKDVSRCCFLPYDPCVYLNEKYI